jgi:hypothetical protein
MNPGDAGWWRRRESNPLQGGERVADFKGDGAFARGFGGGWTRVVPFGSRVGCWVAAHGRHMGKGT